MPLVVSMNQTAPPPSARARGSCRGTEAQPLSRVMHSLGVSRSERIEARLSVRRTVPRLMSLQANAR